MNYDEWIEATFSVEETDDHEVVWCEEKPDAEPSERETLQRVTRLFESSEESLKAYSDKQIALGLNSLTNETEDSLRGIYNIAIPFDERLAAVRSVYSLFRDCLAKRCENCRVNDSTNPLNRYCHMFWDAGQISLYGFTNVNDDHREDLSEAVLEVLKKTLDLRHVACAEAALHGLGHSMMLLGETTEYGKKITKIIDAFLRSQETKDSLKEYAKQAKKGMVL